MIELIPKWIMYEEFWRALKRRNLWLIRLRYAAAVMLIGIIAAGALFEHVYIDSWVIAGLFCFILLYNATFHRLHRLLPDGYSAFHGLHFALLQMTFDFIALMALIYVTGGVESPFFYFFIFHVIIGSLLLPMQVISLLITATLFITLGGAMMELHGIIPHQNVDGYMPCPMYLNSTYIGVHFTILAVTLFISNFLANSISKELYLRERSLTEAYRQLEEAEVAKSRYVMSVVHDLKTPIAAASTYLDMILDGSLGTLPEVFERPLERSRLRLTNAINVVNDILQLTQLKLEDKPDFSNVNLTELIDEIYQEMRILFVSKKLRFSTWINSEHDVHVEAERRLLKLALSNVISNTHKYTPSDGKVEIHIREKDDKVRIEIADSGIGIPPQEQKKIFEDFFRSSNAKRLGIEGTGLGLSVVSHILKQFNGSITVESPSRLATGPERPGSAFFITLPKSYSPPLSLVGNTEV